MIESREKTLLNLEALVGTVAALVDTLGLLMSLEEVTFRLRF